MKENNIWDNQAFCFRISVIFVLVWLAISSSISLIIYLSFGNDLTDNNILEFSTWCFIIPAIIAFGLINAIPLMRDWLLEPFRDVNEPLNQKKPTKNTGYSYSQLSSRLENPLSDEI
jgi:hypothetical protein